MSAPSKAHLMSKIVFVSLHITKIFLIGESSMSLGITYKFGNNFNINPSVGYSRLEKLDNQRTFIVDIYLDWQLDINLIMPLALELFQSTMILMTNSLFSLY